MTSLFPWESVKVKTLRSVSRDLGLSASGTKREMIENLQGVAGVDSEDREYNHHAFEPGEIPTKLVLLHCHLCCSR